MEITHASGSREMRAAALALAAALTLTAALAAPALAAPAFSQGHGYRHGVVPPRPGAHHHGASAAPAPPVDNLTYGGGLEGVGVTTGHEKVYLVFWGSQWGTKSTNAQGYTTLSGDPSKAAAPLQAFFKGLGTGGERWSGVMTQYCEGVAAGALSCPSTAAHVAYPTGGALAGVWVDESAKAPASALGSDLGAEAVAAAGHFGNTTTAANRDAQYIIVSPTGTTPDGFNTPNGQFCAWHDFTDDSFLSGGAVSSPYGPVAFTNLPYQTDAGAACGQNFVNSGSAGTDDGFTIVGGHEYAETITDQFPAGGWTDSSGNEDGDKCAWITSGQGASQNIALTTGTFAVQSTWSDDTSNCEVTHAIVGGSTSSNTVTVTNPGNQTSTAGTAVSLQLHATDSASGQTLTYSAIGLPAGLSISSSGLISGKPTTAGSSSVTLTATDATGASGSATLTWGVNPAAGGTCKAAQLLGNPGFETGSMSPWSASTGVLNNSSSEPPHSGSWDAWLDGYGTFHVDSLSQTVVLPSGCSSYSLSFWLHIDTGNPATVAQDVLHVQVLSSTGSVIRTLGAYSNMTPIAGYAQKTFSLAPYAGTTIILKLTGTETVGPTSFVVDDFALHVS
jgi:serine protease